MISHLRSWRVALAPSLVGLLLSVSPAAPPPPASLPDPEAPALVPSAPSPLASCDARVLAAAAEADLRMRAQSSCPPEELAKLAAGVRELDRCAGEPTAASDRWFFPVANLPPARSIGGLDGNGFVRPRRLRCYAERYGGHPAHDLFVHDPLRTGRDRQGNPFVARAVEDGAVLVAYDAWKPGDAGRGGNYVMLYLPARKQIAYYAHLEAVWVKAGERVHAGQALGTVGRTGLNAHPRRSPTHLHFGLWDAATFLPVDSYRWLRVADDGNSSRTRASRYRGER